MENVYTSTLIMTRLLYHEYCDEKKGVKAIRET